jgi:hypothetical protein
MLVAVPAAGGGLLGLGIASVFKVGGVGAHGTVHEAIGTSHALGPIPIPQAACAYLDAVRRTATVAAESSTTLLSTKPKPLRVGAYEAVPEQLAALDLALRVAATKVPQPVALELSRAADNVEHGRRLRTVSLDASEYASDIMIPLTDGYLAMNDASRLVGDACGFALLDVPGLKFP